MYCVLPASLRHQVVASRGHSRPHRPAHGRAHEPFDDAEVRARPRERPRRSRPAPPEEGWTNGGQDRRSAPARRSRGDAVSEWPAAVVFDPQSKPVALCPRSTMSFDPGDSFDRYQLGALIGQGGMGRVFRAFDPKLRRRVAIKILQPRRSAHGADQTARMMREAQAAAAIDHPGVVAIFDVGEANGQPFIVMEYVEGRALRSLIGVADIPILERLRWITDIARILAAAHRVGLVHRDIKPENVMVREDGALKLLDFGIAKHVNLDEPTGDSPYGSPSTNLVESSMAGTPCYAAPEQIQRALVDARVDQFSWGVLSYELLTGALPWRSLEEGVSSAVAVVTERQLTLPTETLGLPSHIGDVVDRALEKLPARRFESMQTLLAALDGAAPSKLSVVLPHVGTGNSTERTMTSVDTSDGTQSKVVPPLPEAIRPPSLPLRRRWSERFPWVVAASLGILGALGGVVAKNNPRTASTEYTAPNVTATASASASAPLDIPVEDWRPNALAMEAYTKGLHRVRNAAIEAGVEDFSNAVEFEPGFAAAHLRIAIAQLVDGPHPTGSEHFLAASRLRRRLDNRERAILDAIAPAFETEPPRIDETARRLAELERRFPDDPEILLFRPEVLVIAGWNDDAAALFRAYIQHFPKNATPWLGLAYIHGHRDELSSAREAIVKCIEAAPDALDCYWLKLKLDAYMGRCKDLELGAVRWRELTEFKFATPEQIQGLVGQRVAPSVIDSAVAKSAAGMSVSDAMAYTRSIAVGRLILAGKFVEADRVMVTMPNEIDLSNARYLWLNELRVALQEEMGHKKEAVSIATDVLLRKKSLPDANDVHSEGITEDPTMVFVGALFAAGAIDSAEFESRRTTWMNTWRTRGVTQSERELWARAYAGTARTPAAGKEALDKLAPHGPPRRFLNEQLLVVDAARVYLLAGRIDEASALLREACASCLSVHEPIRYVQAYALLGHSSEAQKDIDAACKAYSVVLEHWSTAIPRSVTADEARTRYDALRCTPRRR